MNSKVYKVYNTNLQNQNTKILSEQETKTSIDSLNLSVRSYNALKRNRILFVEDLLSLSYKQLKTIRNLGKTSVLEIISKVHLLGLKFNFEENTTCYNNDTLNEYSEINKQINELKQEKEKLEKRINELRSRQEMIYDNLCYRKEL